MLCLVPEELHSEKGAKAAETGCKQKKGLFRDPPFAFLGLGFVNSVKDEGDKVHYYVKHKKNLHPYIIIVLMSFSKAIKGVFFRIAVLALCLTAAIFVPSCSIFDDEDPGDVSYEESKNVSSGSSSSESEETLPSSTDIEMGFEKVSKAYVYCTWYDVEKDNPASYNVMDSDDAYALKCVFYFREPISATFRAVLKNEAGQVAVKTIRLDEKVIAECDFSAGLEGMDSFKAGTYKIILENEGKSVAISSEMRVE